MRTLTDMLGMGQFGGNYLGNMLGQPPFEGCGNGFSPLAQYQQQQMGWQANSLAKMLGSTYDPEAEKARQRAYVKQHAEDLAAETEAVLMRAAFWMGLYATPVIGWAFAPVIMHLAAKAERLLTEAESWLAKDRH